MTSETDNAIRAACRRCTEEIQQAMRKKIEALGVSLLEFVVKTGRLNGRFGAEQ